MTDIRALVFQAMNNAVANGYGDFMRNGHARAVAEDLIDYDDDIAKSEIPPGELVPIIEAWRQLD